MGLLSLTLVAGFALGPALGPQAPMLSAADEEFFESKVRPVLVAQCYECHSSAAKKLKGGLRLDTRAGWEMGGDSGAAIVPGDPEASLFVKAIRYAEADVQMPPKGKLDDAQIADLVEWVRRGAPDPRAGEAEAARKELDLEAALRHWAFQPTRDVVPPDTGNKSWCTNEVDRFVLARLEAEGLAPALAADKRTLIRRATFDLTGLPPTPEEIGAFLADDAPRAYEDVVDRLLASPAYGERAARAWLDLARYADSNGLDENLAMSNAWRWRDWVIRALNADVPYDQFLTLQLAGDLLPEPADEQAAKDQRAATGFLVLGPKVLAEQDKVKLVMDMVDEQIDVTSKALLGLTMACARCHDHKFDPILQRDYYALAGIFKSTSTLANTDFVSRWREVELATNAQLAARDAHEAKKKQLEGTLAEARAQGEATSVADWRRSAAAYLLAGEAAGRATILVEAEEPSRGNLIADRETWGTAEVVIARTGDGTDPQFAEYDVVMPRAGAWQIEVRYASAEERPMTLSIDGQEVASDVLKATTGTFHPDTQTWARMGTFELRAGRSVVRLERTGPVPHLDMLLFVPAPAADLAVDWPANVKEASGLVPDVVRNWAVYLEKRERAADPVLRVWSEFARLEASTFETRAKDLAADLSARTAKQELAISPLVLHAIEGLPPASLRDLAGRYQTVFGLVDDLWAKAFAAASDKSAAKLDDADQESVRQILYGTNGPFALTKGLQSRYFPPEVRATIELRESELAAHAKTMPTPFETSPGVREGEIVDLPLHVRGSHLKLAGDPVPRGFPEVLCASVPAVAIDPKASGRLEFARWLVDPKHPLTARVMVNRVWKGHFGFGLVRSPSNFGLRGEAPSHPELLDWLAREFVRRKWSLKSMHKLVMMSSTYRQSSSFDEVAAAKDPENRLVWRMNRRRLEAECVRDGLMAVAGTLDRTLYGTLLATKNFDYVTNDQSNDAARYVTHRRTIYLPMIRNAVYDLFSTFDYPDPSMPVDARSSTIDPSQSLLLMNSPLALEEALAFARSLLAEPMSTSSPATPEAPSATASAAPKVAAPAVEGPRTDRERVEAAYERAFARRAGEGEVNRALAFVSATASKLEGDAAAKREGAWRALCQVLLASNEFLHID